jgi:hypothetical protein
LPDGQFDIQEDRFQLYNPPQSAELVDDAKASNGRAARMPGGRGDWATQFPLPADAPFMNKGTFTTYLVIRADVDKAEGAPFLYGLQDGAAGRVIAMTHGDMKKAADGDYHTYAISVNEFRPGMYFWVAPPASGNVRWVYADRIFIRKDTK